MDFEYIVIDRNIYGDIIIMGRYQNGNVVKRWYIGYNEKHALHDFREHTNTKYKHLLIIRL